MEVEDATEQIQTHKQQWERQLQAVQPNSASLYAAMHFTHLTSERTHFRKGSKVMYLQSWSWWVCSTVRVCACSLPAHIIYQQCLQCVCKCLSMSERIPLCVSCIITLGGGDWAGRTRTVKKWTRHICTKRVSASQYVKIWITWITVHNTEPHLCHELWRSD